MNETNQKTKKHKTLKIVLIVVLSLVVVSAFILLLGVPAYISSDSGRKTILTKINKAVDGTTDFASLSMGWFKGIKVTDFAYNDDIGQTSVTIKQIKTKPHYASLLAGNLSFGKTVIDQPRVTIDLQRTAETPAASKSSGEKKETKPTVKLPVKKIDLHINDGNVKVTNAKANTIHLADINSRLDLKGLDKNNNFVADMTIADSDKATPLHAQGTINPKKISGNLTVEVNELDMSALQPLMDMAEVRIDTKGLVTANIKTEFENSKLQSLNGTVTGKNINVGGPAVKGDRFETSQLIFDTQLNRQGNLINIDKFNLTTDWAKVDATGKIPTALDSLSQFLEPNADYDLQCSIEVDLPALANQMPNTLKLQQGTALTSGRLTSNIARTTQPDKAKIEAYFRITDIAGLVDQKQIALAEPITAQALITSNQSQVVLEKLQATSSFAQVICSGNEKLLSYEANADLQKLQSQLGSFIDLGNYQMQGTINSVGKIIPEKNNLNVTGSSTVNNLRLTTAQGQSASEPQANVTMDLDIDRKTTDIAINNLDCKATLGNVRIQNGYLPASKTQKQLSLPIEAELDLAKARPFAMLTDFYPKKLQLAGTATSNLKITAGDETFTLTTDDTKIKNFSYGTPDAGTVDLGLVDAKLDITSQPKETLIKFDVSNPQIKLKGDFKAETDKQQRTVSAKADCDYDWKFVSLLLSAFMPEDLAVEGKNQTTLEFASSYPADNPDLMWANMNLKPLTIAFDKAQYRGFTTTKPAQIEVRFNEGVLDIPKFSINVNEGTFNFAGQADFNREKTLLRLTEPLPILQNIKIDERLAVQVLQYLNPIFKDVDQITGTASFSARKLAIPLQNASKEDLLLDGTFSVANMRLISPIFTLIRRFRGGTTQDSLMQLRPTNITVQNGLVRYDNMQLEVGNNPFNFVGRINLITKNIEGSKVITPWTAGETIKVGQEDTPGRISGNFVGTYDNPNIDWVDVILKEGLRELLRNL